MGRRENDAAQRTDEVVVVAASTHDDTVQGHEKDGVGDATAGVQQRHAARNMHLEKSKRGIQLQPSNETNGDDDGTNTTVEDLARIRQRRENHRNLQSKQEGVAEVVVEEEPLLDDLTPVHPTSQHMRGIDTGRTHDVEENSNDAPNFEAQVVENLMLAEVVDEGKQKKAATKKFQRSIGIVVLTLLVVLLVVVGGLCGSGFCSRSARSAVSVAEPCNLLVSGQVNVQTMELERLDALSRSFFAACVLFNPDVPIVDPEGLCGVSAEWCDVLPYQISFLLNGGNCSLNEDPVLDPAKFSCQDGTTAFPPIVERGFTTYIRATDVLQPDRVFFADYVSVGVDSFTLTNRGAAIGPDIRIEIFDSQESATNDDENGLMQTILYYDICSYPEEQQSLFGAVQSIEYFYGSQSLKLSSGTTSMEIEISVEGPNRILLQPQEEGDDGEDDPTAVAISVDTVVLTHSFAATVTVVTDEDGGDAFASTITAVRDPNGVVVGSATLDIPWIQNTTERFTLQAEVTGTGPNGEACSGIGLVDFRAEYV